jgi:hypothetical protein
MKPFLVYPFIRTAVGSALVGKAEIVPALNGTHLKIYAGVKAYLKLFLTSAVDGCE